MTQGISRYRLPAVLGWLYLVVAVSLTLWAYSPALDAGFVFDDDGLVHNKIAEQKPEGKREVFVGIEVEVGFKLG